MSPRAFRKSFQGFLERSPWQFPPDVQQDPEVEGTEPPTVDAEVVDLTGEPA